jgi:hypothetical protein
MSAQVKISLYRETYARDKVVQYLETLRLVQCQPPG